MSGETLTIGSMEFTEGTPDTTQTETLIKLAEVIEVELSDIRFGPHSRKWSFQSLNWASHIEKEQIETFLEQHKKVIKQFTCSLHYLNNPEEINYRS